MKLAVKNVVLLVLMLLSVALGSTFRPTIPLADGREPVNLIAIVPTAFGDWKEQINLVSQIVDPQLKAGIDNIYSQTLTRTYINSQGYRVMLSIAYGKQQNDQLRAHQPEGCYLGQGFYLVLPSEATEISTSAGSFGITRLVAAKASRNEPITYWIRIGDDIARTQWEMKKIQIHYALSGKIPDGMLVRVSSIATNNTEAFAQQRNFINDLLSGMSPLHRQYLTGEKIN